MKTLKKCLKIFLLASIGITSLSGFSQSEKRTKEILVTAHAVSSGESTILIASYNRIFQISQALDPHKEYKLILMVDPEEQTKKHGRGQSGTLNADLVNFRTSLNQHKKDLALMIVNQKLDKVQ